MTFDGVLRGQQRPVLALLTRLALLRRKNQYWLLRQDAPHAALPTIKLSSQLWQMTNFTAPKFRDILMVAIYFI